MEYNQIHYKVFRQVKGSWKWITTFYNYREAYLYIQSRTGVYQIIEEESVD